MYSFPELVLSVMLAAYVTVCLMVAVMRWGHKCQPYAAHIDYYYPGWRNVVFCFLSNITLIPAIFMPGETDALLQLRMILILSSPCLCAILIFSYFGQVLKVSWWRKPIYALTISYGIMSALSLTWTLMPGTQLQGRFLNWFFYVGSTLALVYLIVFIQALLMIAGALRRFSEENYSNPDDFPKQYAENVLIIAVLHLIMSWSTTFNGAYWALSFGLLILCVLTVIFLLGILSPHRAVEVDQLEAEAGAGAEPVAEAALPQEEGELLTRERKEELLQRIRYQVEQQEAFLDSHLTLAGLSRSCGINRTYISMVLTEYMGGFFSYVNRCRLAYAGNYRTEHPEADVDEVALSSGFNSRQSYYNARKRLEK